MFGKFFKRVLCSAMSLAICGTIVFGLPISANAKGNLVARWSFEGPLPCLADATGNGYNLTANIPVTPVDNSIKKTAFKGPNNTPYVMSVQNSNTAFATAHFTITAWVKFEQDPADNLWGQAKILDFCSIGAGIYEGYSLYLERGGYLSFTLSNAAGTKWTTLKSTNTLSAYNWHHVAAVYDWDSMKIYIDGVLAGQRYYTEGYKKPAGDVHIGSQLRRNGDVYCSNSSYMDEISFYDDVLTSDEIGRDYSAFSTTCVVADDTVYETRPYNGGYYAYAMEKTATARLYNYGTLEFVITTKKACPVIGLQVTSWTHAEILDVYGNVIYTSGYKSYTVTTDEISSRTDTCYEYNIPSNIISQAAYVRVY